MEHLLSPPESHRLHLLYPLGNQGKSPKEDGSAGKGCSAGARGDRMSAVAKGEDSCLGQPGAAFKDRRAAMGRSE